VAGEEVREGKHVVCTSLITYEAARDLHVRRDIMKAKNILVVWCVLIAVLSTICLAQDFAGNRELFIGEGLQLNLSGAGTYQIYADEPAWLAHGWMNAERYPGQIPDRLRETGAVDSGGGLYFKLQINGKPVHLSHKVLLFHLDEPGEWGRYETWYIQFPAGYFKPGVYELRGEWGCRNPRNGLNTMAIVPFERYVTLIVLEPEP